MVRTANSFKFFFKKVTKSWRKGKPPPCWEFHEYSDNEKLCVVVCIAEYLGWSASWHTQGQNQLLLGHIKPYKEVQSSTIADWVKLVLKMVGIDTSLYKAHSCRSASTLSLQYWVRLLKTYWKEVNGQGHRIGKDIIIGKWWIEGRVVSLKLLFSPMLWTKVPWMYGFQYGRDWSWLSKMRFYKVKLKN